MFTGESLMLNTYTAERPGEIAFASSFPGSIIAVEVNPNTPVIAQKSAFLASYGNVEVSVHVQKKIGGGFFGTIISALVVGLIIGALGRLIVPGKQDMPIWLTMSKQALASSKALGLARPMSSAARMQRRRAMKSGSSPPSSIRASQ